MIALDDVHKAFDGKPVLRGVTLSVAARESMVIIGRSGSGKSVMMKSVLGLVIPDRGRVHLAGREVLGAPLQNAAFARFGMLFQGAALFDSLPVWQNVAFRLLRGAERRPRGEAREIAMDKLRRVGLGPEVAELYPAELSGGMQKRVGLARAIASDPEIIFFDEPTAGLDPIMARVINDLIREITREMGATTLTITHDMASAQAIADRIALLHEGVIRWTGPAHMLEDCDNPYVRQFIDGARDGPMTVVGD